MKKLALLLAFASGVAFAQGNCNQTLNFTSATRGAAFDNRSQKCDLWTLISQNNNGFSALSIEIDGAPDNQGSPGTWFTVAALPPGSNPCTDINTCYVISKTAYPWVSINVTSVTGTGKISARLSGVNTMANVVTTASSSSSSGGTTVTFSQPFVTAGTSVFGPAWTLTAPPLTGWTFDNQGASTNDTSLGYDYGHFGAGGATQIRMLYRTAPATPYSITVLMAGSPAPPTIGAENMIAFGFRDGTGKWETFMMGVTTSNYGVMITRWNSATSFNANVYTATGQIALGMLAMNQALFVKIVDTGVNLTYHLSVDGGNHFQQMYSESRTAFFGSGPNAVGWGAYTNSTTVDNALFSWLQGTS